MKRAADKAAFFILPNHFQKP